MTPNDIMTEMVIDREHRALADQNLPQTDLGRSLLNSTSMVFELDYEMAARTIRNWCDRGDRDALDFVIWEANNRMGNVYELPCRAATAGFVRAARNAVGRVH